MKVLLVDDHPLVQDAIKLILDRHYDGVIINNAYDYAQAINIVNSESDFDLVMFDLGLPDLHGFDGLRRIVRVLDTTPLIVLSASEDAVDVQAALSAGAKGYISKSASNEVIAGAIKVVLAGEKYVPFSVLDSGNNNVGQYHKSMEEHKSESIGEINLSNRQTEVLRLVIKGKTNKEIGRHLSISATTARAHISAIFKELNVTNRTQACYVAAQIGLWPEGNKPE